MTKKNITVSVSGDQAVGKTEIALAINQALAALGYEVDISGIAIVDGERDIFPAVLEERKTNRIDLSDRVRVVLKEVYLRPTILKG